MKKKYDLSIIFTVIIIIGFVVGIAIYFYSNNIANTNNITNNHPDNNVNSIIYTEHSHKIAEEQAITNVSKEYVEIATYTTKIHDKDKNRVYNIKLASQRLDGVIVKTGEEFSFNNTMGGMGAADGYKKSVGFDSNGKKVKMYGGGMCQISSTLYNSVLIAKLKVTERHAHSRRVYYVPKDKDATVYSGGPDFKFINTTPYNLMICVSTDGYTVTVSLKTEQIPQK